MPVTCADLNLLEATKIKATGIVGVTTSYPA